MGLWSTGFLERMEELGLYKKPELIEVVKCKDCKYYRYYGLNSDTVSECIINHVENPAGNWFCADGERKE